MKLPFMAMALFIIALGSVHAMYAAPPNKGCSLLTTAQISSVLGVKVGAPRGAGNMCYWIEPHRPGAPSKRVLLVLLNSQAFAFAKMPMEGYGIIKTDVSGIGDDAVYGKSPRNPTVLTVKKGNTVFNIHVVGFPDDQTEAKEKTLALEVCSKL
jgi:hypothetical protein